jgi:hypothetical protein
MIEDEACGETTVGIEKEVQDFIRAKFKNNTSSTITKYKDGTFSINTDVNNQKMHLTQTDLVNVLTTALFYFGIEDIDLVSILQESIELGDKEIKYTYSNNIRNKLNKKLNVYNK